MFVWFVKCMYILGNSHEHQKGNVAGLGVQQKSAHSSFYQKVLNTKS